MEGSDRAPSVLDMDVMRPESGGSQGIPPAPYEVEAEAIRHLIVIEKMREKGVDYYDIVRSNPRQALHMLQKDALHSFSPKSDNHRCSGSSDVHWKLAEMQKIRDQYGAKNFPGGLPQWNEEYQRLLAKQQAQPGCSFSNMREGDRFFHLSDCNTYLATGDVYVCIKSGEPHVCNQTMCRMQIGMAHNEGIECALTHKFFGQSMVYAEERSRESEGNRDGCMTFIGARGGAGSYYGGGSRSRGGSVVFRRNSGDARQKKRQQAERDRSSESAEARSRALDPDKSAFKTPAGREDVTLLEEHMAAAFPRAKMPVAGRAGRAAVTEICTALIYDKEVRKQTWTKLKASEERAGQLIRAYYEECRSEGKMRNPLRVMDLLAENVKTHFDRLCTIGIFDSDPDQEVLAYFHDCIVCAWTLLHYTPFARRFQNGIPLTSKHVVGLLYKLQTGFYVSATYDVATKRVISFSSSSSSSSSSAASSSPATSEGAPENSGPPPARPSGPEKPSLAGLLIGSDEASDYDNGGAGEALEDELMLPGEESRGPRAGAGAEPSSSGGVATALVCFIPRHKFLQRMPQKSDLNKFAAFKRSGLSSSLVVNTDKLVSDCYESLMTQPGCTVEKLLDFALERYINLREFA